MPTLYEALNQLSVPALGGWRSFGLTLVARTSMAPTNAISGITEAVHKLNPDIPIQSIATMDQLTSDSLAQQRFNMLLLASFAGLALLLAAIGIYSVLAYSVRRRVREIGIRMALGAQIGDVLRLIVVEGMKPTLIGLGIGLAGALALGHVLSSLLYGVNARDAATFASVSIVLTGVGLLASVIPAYRASRIEPVKTLRDE
jgi:ABC-type antimicrobial peptide transport system permease subunit